MTCIILFLCFIIKEQLFNFCVFLWNYLFTYAINKKPPQSMEHYIQRFGAVCYDSVLSKLPASNRMLIYQRFSGYSVCFSK